MVDMLLKSKPTVDKMIKHRYQQLLTEDTYFEMYRMDDSIIVRYDKGKLVYIEMYCTKETLRNQMRAVGQHFKTTEVIFTKVFYYDTKGNKWLVDIGYDDSTDRFYLYIQLFDEKR